ncbi:MAG: glycosyltransferase family 4 protein [Bacteroidota bacterium]
MEILFVTHKYPPIIGGMEKQSFELISRMSNKHQVHILAYKGEGSKLKWFLSLKRRIKSILRENPTIQLVHLNDGLMAAACSWLKKYTSIPVVATYHGLDITFPSTIFQKRIMPKLHKLDRGICVSNATAQACVERGFERNKIDVVLNGVDHDLADIPIDPEFRSNVERVLNLNLNEKKVIVTMGRAVRRKGFSWFLQNVVPNLSDDVIFMMIGPLSTKISLSEKIVNGLPGSLRSKVQLMFGMATDVKAITTALTDEKLRGKVFHLGKVSFKDLMQYLSLADVFVMPNIKVEGDAEGFGLVALEASLRGLPVIAAGIEGITDAVRDGKNGILLASGNARVWIDTLNDLLANDARLAQLSESAVRTTLEDYGWDLMVSGYEEVFKQVVIG